MFGLGCGELGIRLGLSRLKPEMKWRVLNDGTSVGKKIKVMVYRVNSILCYKHRR